MGNNEKLFRVTCVGENRPLKYVQDVYAIDAATAKAKVVESMKDGTFMFVKGTKVKVSVKELKTW
jgi:hypothetical protein